MFDTVRKRYQAGKEARRYDERNWRLDLAFLIGEQWVTYDKYSNRLRLVSPGKKKPRLVSNIILPRVRLEYTQITQLTPVYKVVTGGGSQDASAKARGAYLYLDYLWNVYKYEQAYRGALLWALSCGTGFTKQIFDPNKGPEYSAGDISFRAGDPIVDSCSPFEIIVDPYARNMDEASWVVHERLRSKEYVEQKYGKSVSESWSDYDTFEQNLSLLRAAPVKSRIPSVLVCEYLERPNAQNPKGYRLVFSGNTVLDESDNPYADCAPIPFAMYKRISIPGRFYGDSSVTHLRQVNVVYNRLRGDILENTTKLSNPPLIVPLGAMENEPEFTPAEVITYNPMMAQGGKVDQLRIEPYQAAVVNMLLRLEQEADEISGVTALMRGNIPRGVRSADQLSIVRMADETRRSDIIKAYAEFIETSLNQVLALAKKFCTVPRLINVVGDKRSSVLFKGDNIPDGTAVRVNVELQNPAVQPSEIQMLLGLLDRGIIQDPRLVVRLSKYGSMEEVFTDLDLDTSQAQRENDRMAAGQDVAVEDWHNHKIHILEHNRYRKTEEYEKLPSEVKVVFDRHVNDHAAKDAPQNKTTMPLPVMGTGGVDVGSGS